MFLSLFVCLGFISPVVAQHVSVNVNINLDRQPAWGPVGYDYVDFYYFPDINIYYDINYAMFYYPSGRRWIASRYLPVKYARYDLYAMYKVPLINEVDPWLYNRSHKRMYAHYRGYSNQVVIYYATDNRYVNYRQNHVHWIDPGVTVKNNMSNKRVTTSGISNRGTTTPTTTNRTTTNSGSNRSTTTTTNKNASNRSTTNPTTNNNKTTTTNRSTNNSSSRSTTTNSSTSGSSSTRSTTTNSSSGNSSRTSTNSSVNSSNRTSTKSDNNSSTTKSSTRSSSGSSSSRSSR